MNDSCEFLLGILLLKVFYFARKKGLLNSVRSRYKEIDQLLATVKSHIQLTLQTRHFEKDALEASHNLEQWAEELRYLDENESQALLGASAAVAASAAGSDQNGGAGTVTSGPTAESVESWLHSQIQTANQMQVLVFELMQRGCDLIQHLDANASTGTNSSSETLINDCLNNGAVTTAATAAANQHTLNWIKQQNAQLNGGACATTTTSVVDLSPSALSVKQRVQYYVEYLSEREKELHELAVQQQRRLGKTLQLTQLEAECGQLVGYLTQVEASLFGMLRFARSLDEAEQVRRDHESFKCNVEHVSVRVSMLQAKAQRVLADHKHQHQQQQQQQQQSSKSLSKFEQLSNTLNAKWQMLIIYVDNRTRLVMAQINFYKYTEQVTSVLESLEAEYRRDEDWYEKACGEKDATGDAEQYVHAQLQMHAQKKQSFLKACNWARRTAETYHKYSVRNLSDAKITGLNGFVHFT